MLKIVVVNKHIAEEINLPVNPWTRGLDNLDYSTMADYAPSSSAPMPLGQAKRSKARGSMPAMPTQAAGFGFGSLMGGFSEYVAF